MEEVINEAVTPEAETTVYTPSGVAEDGTIYDATSPAVLAYQAKFPEVIDIEQVIGSILNMHNIIARGGTPAGEGLEEIVDIIKNGLTKTEAPE